MFPWWIACMSSRSSQASLGGWWGIEWQSAVSGGEKENRSWHWMTFPPHLVKSILEPPPKQSKGASAARSAVQQTSAWRQLHSKDWQYGLQIFSQSFLAFIAWTKIEKTIFIFVLTGIFRVPGNSPNNVRNICGVCFRGDSIHCRAPTACAQQSFEPRKARKFFGFKSSDHLQRLLSKFASLRSYREQFAALPYPKTHFRGPGLWWDHSELLAKIATFSLCETKPGSL